MKEVKEKLKETETTYRTGAGYHKIPSGGFGDPRYRSGHPLAPGTQTLTNIKVFFLPMKSLEEIIGVIGIQSEFKSLLFDQRRLLSAISNISSLAAGRWVKLWAVK